MAFKILAVGASSLLSLLLSGFLPPGGPDAKPEPKARKKEGPGGPAGDLRKAYDLLRKVRGDNRSSGRPEERLRDWTDRATKLYRDGVREFKDGNERLAHEYGAAAHDLARAIDHARNASLFDGQDKDDDLPPPPAGRGPDEGDRFRGDLRRAYDRIRDGLDVAEGSEARYYLDAARDLYNAARLDAEADRTARAGELARAAEALTHVPEHLAHAAAKGPDAKPEPRKKHGARKDEGPDAKKHRPDPKKERPDSKKERERELPPPL